MIKSTPTLHDVYLAKARIQTLIRATPLLTSSHLAHITDAKKVYLKPENLQNTGSFKVRGAANKILSLTDKQKQKGVITFSTGNHGKAAAYVANQIGVKAMVCLSAHVAPYRAQLIADLGADISVKGESQDEAERNYQQLMAERGLIPVVPFDDPHIIAGQGTIALEILDEVPETDVIIVPLSGGGLLAGVAMAAKSVNPNIHIVGVSLERSPAMLESLKSGQPVQVEEKDSVADSLLGGIGFDNRYTLEMVEKYTDEHLLVSEPEIKDAMYYIFDKHRLIVEGAAAVSVAALLSQKIDVKGQNVAALMTGSSIDAGQYLGIIQKRLIL